VCLLISGGGDYLMHFGLLGEVGKEGGNVQAINRTVRHGSTALATIKIFLK